ncbi:MAG: hypothetical protein CK539_06585 [Flavobacteriales bacterium]|nr:MAG: hypothetical protein CK539_06585 [Flavobacteriales bacterium]
MKKIIFNLTAIAFVSLLLTSCGGNSIESDAKKYAELMCKAQKLATEGAAKAATGDMSALTESTKLASEAATLMKEWEGKYTSDSDKKKLADAYLIEMGNCK